ncbi:MAG: FHA domain-containing protein [Polyangia bacterium]
MPKLVFHDSDGVDKTLQLGTEPVFIGRASECQVQTHDAMVSRKHARITYDGGYFVEDLGSSNGVFLGAEKVQRAQFRPGDVVTCGSLVLRMLPEARRSQPGTGDAPKPRPPEPLPRQADPAPPVEWNQVSETSTSPPLAAAGDVSKLRTELRREIERRESAEAKLAEAEQRSHGADEAAREMIQLRRRIEQLQSAPAHPSTPFDVHEVNEAIALFNDALAELKASLRAGVDEAQLLTAPSDSVHVVRDALRSGMEELERARGRLREMVRALALPDA